jgi:hypothetical protein
MHPTQKRKKKERKGKTRLAVSRLHSHLQLAKLQLLLVLETIA